MKTVERCSTYLGVNKMLSLVNLCDERSDKLSL